MAVARPAFRASFAAQALLVLHMVALLVAATSITATTSPTPLTCPFRTINYITHSLPQQCLTSTRRTNHTSTASEATSLTTADLPSSTHAAIERTASSLAISPTPIASTPLDSISFPRQNATLTATATTESAQPVSSSLSLRSPTTSAADATDDESPLEDGKFLSFEDWKRENLKKAGQSEHVGRGHGIDRETRKRPSIVQDSLDALGDDAEIDLDFSGFVSDGLESVVQGQPRGSQKIEDSPSSIKPGHAPRAGIRNKDAGTTCKERFNYASFDCAASVLKTNPEAKSPSAVLGKNKDSYMLNECSAQNKFLILELCDDISIDTIVLANFEFFSSTFRTFRVSVSDKYPVKVDKWKTLGTFEARNSRDVQAFLVENPVIWARYLRIEFLTHYGNEYYCPVSLVRVHGTTMLEDYKHDLQSLQVEDDETESQEGDQSSAMDELIPEAVAEPLLKNTEAVESEIHAQTVEVADLAPSDPPPTPSGSASTARAQTTLTVVSPMPTSPANISAIFSGLTLHDAAFGVCKPGDNTTGIKPEVSPPVSNKHSQSVESVAGASSPSVTNTTGTIAVTTPEYSVTDPATSSSDSQSPGPKPDVSDNSTVTRDSSSTANSNNTKIATSTMQSVPPAPTMQESFFKSVQKRLQMLEANSSLSLQYIEEQSRALRDAFHRVEQRQLAKTSSFLEYLNGTVLNELRDFRQQYDQLWQSTVIELELQRERYQQENLAINARLGILADEVIFQKRMSVLQMILILICLGLVIFSRGSLNSYLELPLVQSVLARSPSSRWLNLPNLDTPSNSPAVSRSQSTRSARIHPGILKGHQRSASDESAADTLSPSDIFSPPTPVSLGNTSDEGEFGEVGTRLGDPQFDPSLIKRPGTSPPILPGTESPSGSETNGDHGADMIDSVLLSSSPGRPESRTPRLIIHDASPPSKRLTWQLPET
ncbi:hypothetical protein A1O3_08241 [Capronia epimyces CBS 606.96]|uniref:SUN domain-containing protein n=1 Tax=Capronia epimyces CBS 606.96 TaxID=1182542 RepID=W9XRJ9_9EURO|nr:uncharacterized protein A1O3_08241 [Capronia epimyces CBS 606.96]EXJ79955.1 hypothetical protein A1O3_08241 [Capronia epimyces CBS 606.96]